MHLQMGGIKDHFIIIHPQIHCERRCELMVKWWAIFYMKDLRPNSNIPSTRLGGISNLFPPMNSKNEFC